MKTRTLLTLCLTLFAFSALLLADIAYADMICPVTKRNAKEKFSYEHKGVKYFFSSRSARMLFKLKPGRYLKKEEGTVAGEQTVCPVMGGKIVKSVYTDHKGRRIYFCCGGCIATFKASPDKYLKILDKGLKKITKTKQACEPGCKCDSCEEKKSKALVYLKNQKKKAEAAACVSG